MTSFPESSGPVAPPKGVSRVTLEEVATLEGVEGKEPAEMACSSREMTGGVMWLGVCETAAVGLGG